ncbi:Flp family type IVb pilin [Sinorhizobium sp. RAC02]|uniref:Flp family type IVb pilin n=1 Tax=Sinorhizobium sp. RAC02 TaxID=1842534 RepID=UPI00083D557D|nr:Flp family type IVb pilin [Sinorhizobium sp. RAC02]AOF91619.1 flp/Fap pilin component family protein [Sinorhizobium sp. RAC02]
MVRRLLKSFLSSCNGATAVEYGLLAGLIAIGLLAGLQAFSGSLGNVFNTVTTSIESARN